MTIMFSQYLATFFVLQSRMNNQGFQSYNAYNQWSIYKYSTVQFPDDFYEIAYVFQNTNITSASGKSDVADSQESRSFLAK